MTTQITWVIENMYCLLQEGNLTNVVIVAAWRCSGVNGDCRATVFNLCTFSGAGNPFTPYEQLTQDQVLGWCWDNGVDKDGVEANVEQQIQNQIKPPVVQLPLPWQA